MVPGDMYEWSRVIFAKKSKFHDAGGPDTVVSPGVAATGPDGGEVAVPICLPATELYYNNVVNYTAMVSGRSTMCSLQQCRMEDHNKPNVLEELF